MQNQEKIIDMFNEIAPTYDKANKILSFGIDASWRSSACDQVLKNFNSSLNIADVACGTGDMIQAWINSAKKANLKIEKITGIDPSKQMLKVAKEKLPNCEFKEAKADNTGLSPNTQDIVSISYGIRNVVARTQALREFNRVLKIGGYLVVLEFTKRDKSGPIAKIRDFYLHNILPAIGGFISKNKEAYEYLPKSIEGFLDSNEFCLELEGSGFEMVIVKGFSMDISTMFIAKKVKNI
mgnify:FL=1